MPMMPIVCWLILASGGYPMLRCWSANRTTSLAQAANWAVVAWAAWLWALFPTPSTAGGNIPSYVALSLSACAIVAVLGARRPGVGAWNFVVFGLMAVLMLPVAEAVAAGREMSLGMPRTLFLAAGLAVGLINYLPTRLWPAAVLLSGGCVNELLQLSEFPASGSGALRGAGRLAISLAPWLALACMWQRAQEQSEFNRLWLGFRDRFGLFWSQRVREQFNRSAANAGFPRHLDWKGLHITGDSKADIVTEAALLAVLRALLRRFESDPVVSDGNQEDVPQKA